MADYIDKSLLIAYLAAIKPDKPVSAYGEAAVDVINHIETYVGEMPTITVESEKEEYHEQYADNRA